MMDRRSWIKKSSAAAVAATATATAAIGFAPLNLTGLSQDPEVTRLLFNENPYGPSAKVLARLQEVQARSNRYASFHQYDFLTLKQLIAKQEGVKPTQVVLGHGSIQPLRWIAIMHGGPNAEFVVPAPAFDVVGSYARVMGTKVKTIAADANLRTDLKAMSNAINGKTTLAVVVNPNNPTGTSVATSDLTHFCKSLPSTCLISIDEAYIHYLGPQWRSQSMVSLVSQHPNVLVTRTFSKIYGMAGLRIGFMIASEELVSRIEKEFMMGFPGNMPNTLSVAAAMAALKDEDFLVDSRQKNSQMKQEIYGELIKKGWRHLPSDTNFVYFQTPDFPNFKQLMNKNGVLLAGGWPTKANWGRVTVGNAQEMEVFFKLLRQA